MKKTQTVAVEWLLLALVFVAGYIAAMFYMDWRFADSAFIAGDNATYVHSLCSISGALLITAVVGWSMGVDRTHGNDLP